jgi:hypothetical protein
MYAIQAITLAFSVLLIGFVVEAIRRNRLAERYALLWLGAGFVLLFLSVNRPILDLMAVWLGVAYGPSLLFLVAFLFLLAIVLHFSLVVSAQRNAIRRLAQAVTLLRRDLEESRGAAEGRAPRSEAPLG